MSPYNLLCLRTSAGLLYPADVERAVLPLEAAHAAHVVSVVRELVSGKAVLRCIREGRGRIWKYVEVLAFPAVRAAATGEE